MKSDAWCDVRFIVSVQSSSVHCCPPYHCVGSVWTALIVQPTSMPRHGWHRVWSVSGVNRQANFAVHMIEFR